jgi:hypothetical protein
MTRTLSFLKNINKNKRGVLLDYNYYNDISFGEAVRSVNLLVKLPNGKIKDYFIFGTTKVFGTLKCGCTVVFNKSIFSMGNLDFVMVLDNNKEIAI